MAPPRSDLALGWLPVAARVVSRLRLAGPVNAAARVRGLRRLATLAGGLADRELPAFAGESLQHWYARRGPRGDGRLGTVMLWPDTGRAGTWWASSRAARRSSAPTPSSFGFQAGHGEVSRQIAERALLPRLREAPGDAVVLADGFSCRTQIHELGDGREALHLAEFLAKRAVNSGPPRVPRRARA